MLSKYFTPFLTLLCFLILTNINAQETINSTGESQITEHGSISYSVGQVFFTQHTDIYGNSINQGVQQPFEISVVSQKPKANGIIISLTVFPNPTTNFLTIIAKDYSTNNLQYHIFDVEGKVLQIKNATGEKTLIFTDNMAPGQYYLRVIDKKRIIKVFKIIKN